MFCVLLFYFYYIIVTQFQITLINFQIYSGSFKPDRMHRINSNARVYLIGCNSLNSFVGQRISSSVNIFAL